MTERDLSLKQEIKAVNVSKIRFSISIKIHQYVKNVHQKSKHPVTITIKTQSKSITHFWWKKMDGSLTSKAPCQSFADFLKDLALVRRQMQDVPWQNICWDGMVTYKGEVSHQCVLFFLGGISLHRFILEMRRFWDSIFFIVEMIKSETTRNQNS